jgi:hypothetical protein
MFQKFARSISRITCLRRAPGLQRESSGSVAWFYPHFSGWKRAGGSGIDKVFDSAIHPLRAAGCGVNRFLQSRESKTRLSRLFFNVIRMLGGWNPVSSIEPANCENGHGERRHKSRN